MKASDRVTPTSVLPRADRPLLPCPAHAVAGDQRRGVPVHPGASQVSPAREEPLPDLPPDANDGDHAFHAMLARLTGGISPIALSLAYIDWASHLAAAPQRQMEVIKDALGSASRLGQAALHVSSPDPEPWSLIKPQPQDRRFVAPEWESQPFNLLAQTFLLGEQWWHNTTTGVRGVAP